MSIETYLNNLNVPDNLCEYWDVRVEEVHKSNIKYEDFELIDVSVKPTLGAFIRIFQEGMWYYLSTTELNRLNESIIELGQKAQKFKVNKKTSSIKPYNTTPLQENLIHSSHIRVDKIPIHYKRELCESYFEEIQSSKDLKNVRVTYIDEYKVKHFRSSTHIHYSYDFNQCGLYLGYSVTNEKGRFDDSTHFYGSQIDHLKNLKPNIKKAIEESYQFVDAKTIEAGEYPVVMDNNVVGVFAHESFGHKSEADFMLGDEKAQEKWKIGEKVGNDCLSIVDGGAELGTSGYCPIDDEGFPTQKTYLIKKGILTGRLHSQQTAQVFDEAPTGNGRAINFEFEPIVRMTNTYIEPGPKTLEELISKVQLGVFAKGFKYGTGMSTFTIAPSKCYMIRGGQIAEPVRVSVMSGSVFETLGRIEECSKDYKLKSSAFDGCGKGEQSPLPVGLGGSQVLVNKMVVS